MRLSSSRPDRGSALIEALVIGSFVFVVVVAAVSSSIRVVTTGAAARQAARVAAVHAARHGDTVAAGELARSLMSGGEVTVRRSGYAIQVVIGRTIEVPHPDGILPLTVIGEATVPLAPFRSNRG